MVDFGEYIKKQRESLTYSSGDLAKKVDCSASFITGIERGAQFPSTPMACKMLEALGIRYNQPDPLRLVLLDGTIFHFKSSLRGRNREPKDPRDVVYVRKEPTRFELEQRISALETIVCSLIATGIMTGTTPTGDRTE